ncbi:unnamed protein product, partial [Didymodactylos carnosus]
MSDDDANDLTAPYHEPEAFDSLWQALTWTQIRKRIPISFNKTIRNRYMLANLVYLAYAIGILIIDFNPQVNGSSAVSEVRHTRIFCSSDNDTFTTTEPSKVYVANTPLVNRMYIALAVIHVISATLYWWL